MGDHFDWENAWKATEDFFIKERGSIPEYTEVVIQTAIDIDKGAFSYKYISKQRFLEKFKENLYKVYD